MEKIKSAEELELAIKKIMHELQQEINSCTSTDIRIGLKKGLIKIKGIVE